MRAFSALFLLVGLTLPGDGKAQVVEPDTAKKINYAAPIKSRMYVGNGYDFAMLSTALVTRPGNPSQLTMPRFTALVNFGFNFHYDPNRRMGFYTGVGIKNLGFIEKVDDLTIKRRIYSLGVPVGFKFGDLSLRNFLFFGGGVDIPFNYREKAFESRRGDKEKFNEWFSERTPRVLPFVFAGKSWHPGITLKLQYYPGNFLNPDFTEDVDGVSYKPYDGYKVNVLLLSLGIDIHYGMYKIQEREYQEWKRKRRPVHTM